MSLDALKQCLADCVAACRACLEKCSDMNAECRAACQACIEACTEGTGSYRGCADVCETCAECCRACGCAECQKCAEACDACAAACRQGLRAKELKEAGKSDQFSEQLWARVAHLGISEELKAGSVLEFMVMPAGTHSCNFGQGPATGLKLAKRTIQVDEQAAAALNEQLKAINASRGNKQRAYFDFDHKEEGPAAAWPQEFFWRPDGVYCRAELSQAGAEAIKGKNYRGFSPVFYATKQNPGRVICRTDADLCMGSLVNEPAFHEIEPLWAKDQKDGKDQTISTVQPSAAAVVATSNKNKGKTMDNEATAAAATAENAEALKAKDSKINELEQENQQLKAAEQKRRQDDAKAAVDAAVKRGAIPAQAEQLKAKWQKTCESDPSMIEVLNGMGGTEGLSGRVTNGGQDTVRLQAKEGSARILGALCRLASQSQKIVGVDAVSFQQRGKLAKEVAALYARDVSRNNDVLDTPLYAADVTDANLGVLSGTLVAQRSLELFKYEFPAIGLLATDFSDMPGLFGQTENTRIIVVPAVQEYDATLGDDGRPKGWKTVQAAQAVDVPITLSKHVGIPIVFDSNTLASTVRRLFDEQAPAASYALAKYYVEMLYALFTPANYDGYKTKSAKVPIAYATFPVSLADLGRSTLVNIGAAFNQNEVPLKDRFCLWNSLYYAKLATDPSLVTFFAGQQSPEIISDTQLPRMARFQPIEAPNLPSTNNLVGMALHKAGAVLKARVSNDYTQALPGASYGSVSTITNPDLAGLSASLVQYVNHTNGYAEWRIQAMLGAAKGDKRGGLCLTGAAQ